MWARSEMASLTCYLRLGGPAAASGPEQLALTNHEKGGSHSLHAMAR